MPTSATLRAAALAASAAALLSLTGCSDDSGENNDLSKQTLEWEDCPAPSTAEGGGPPPSPLPGGADWQCSTLQVPRDYGVPDGETIDLALIRGPARDQDRRIGSLIYNFGGPGGSGVATLPSAAKDYERLRERYDLVSFDPRGVGRSAGVKCLNDQQLDAYYSQDATPDNATEEKILADYRKRYSAACERNSGAVLPYVGTLNAARDMDLMRQVLGDDKLHYFGISYGTELGGVYAHQFPQNVGRAVFDAVVDPTKDYEQSSLAQARGFQQALNNFAQDCVDRGDECQLQGSTAEEIEQNIIKFLQQLDKKPIAGIGDRELTQSAATSGIAQTLYSTEFWPLLEQGLDEAYAGNGQLLLALSDAMNGRNEDGTYSNLGAANTAINCVDSKDRFTPAQAKAELPTFSAASPVFGDWLGWGLLGCTDWPVAGAWEDPDVSAPGAAPIVLIGTTGDPATPYEGARAMAQELGKGVGFEVTHRGEGHGAYNSGNKCVQAVVDNYLLRGRVPAAGTVCD
ncbi:alpha/beta hydrolase [Streptomyces sp. NPDC051219]|uniref:alpha/beta hydrolase n=1 Tax=Streptomyces sp. NPDC051219 TaxID=3155283 RepID=UPI003438BD34